MPPTGKSDSELNINVHLHLASGGTVPVHKANNPGSYQMQCEQAKKKVTSVDTTGQLMMVTA